MEKMIRVGLAGAGLSAKVFHTPFWAAGGQFVLRRVFARSLEKGREVFPEAEVTAQFEDLLAEDIDLVVITTPNLTHYALAKQALLAGKHVVVEKPVCVDVEEARELAALADRQGVLLTVYQNRRWDSAPLTAKRLITENVLGDLVNVEIRFERYSADLNKKRWKESGERGVGLVYDLGVHLLDMAVDLFGLPESLYADLSRQHAGALGEDYFDVVLYYPTGLKVRLVGSKYAREPLPFLTLHGKRGSYIKHEADQQESLLAAGAQPVGNWNMETLAQQGILHTEIEGDVVRRPVVSERGDYAAFYRNLYAAVAEGEPLAVKMEQAVEVLRLIDLVYRSAEEGRRLPVCPQA